MPACAGMTFTAPFGQQNQRPTARPSANSSTASVSERKVLEQPLLRHTKAGVAFNMMNNPGEPAVAAAGSTR